MKKMPNQMITVVSMLIAGALLFGCWFYISNVQESLWRLSVTDLKQVTAQASHAFETYLQKDLQNIHGMAVIMEKAGSDDFTYLETCLKAYNDISDDSFYTVANLEKGLLYSDQVEGFVVSLPEERMAIDKEVSGSSVEEPYVSEVNGLTVLACHESFTFADGARGIVCKSSPVSAVVNEFALSVYDGAGFSYIVNREGDILIRSIHRDSNHTYQNVFDAMAMESGQGLGSQSIIGDVRTSMSQGKSGVVRYTTENGVEFVYAYVPIGEPEGWYYITVVPSAVLMEQSNYILNISQLFIGVTVLGILIVFVVVLLVRRNRRAMQRIEQEVQNRRELFDILTNGTGDAFVMFTMRDKTVDYVSPNIFHLLGIPAEDIKKNVALLIDTKEEGEAFNREFSRLEMGGSISLEGQRIFRETGEPRWLAITIYRVLIEEEERAIIVFSDRTVEKKREQALEDATAIAESANRAKSAFLSNMSHDIRTPMNAIVGLCTLIDRDAGNPGQVRDYTRKMLASCQHLLGLINDVLDMSKIEAGKTSLNIGELDLAELLDELVTVLMPQAHAKGQTFEVSAQDIKSEHLLGDKVRLNQILINILSNAIKYTPGGGRIELIIHEMPQKVKGFAHLRFIVKDNGSGIAPEYIDNIFQAFTRETNSNTNKIQGTGLGMAITKSLVDLMEGNISVESRQGEGSTFTVDLDLRIQDREAERRFLVQHGIQRILVVDDEEEVCIQVVSVMEKEGVAVEYALDGYSAIAATEKAYTEGQKFDLILMDLKMPGMDGDETARHIREKISDEVPILAFTSYDWNDVEEEAELSGINGFMPKPFFLSNLERSIERLYKEPPLPSSDADGVLQGLHILAAEDNELNSEILQKLLEMQGASCDIEENGQKALNRFKASREGEYDLILMDVQMPVMNGYEATRGIRGCGHPQAEIIPILAMTADAFAEDVRRAIDAGMNAHVAKPIELERLEEAIREVLKQLKERA